MHIFKTRLFATYNWGGSRHERLIPLGFAGETGSGSLLNRYCRMGGIMNKSTTSHNTPYIGIGAISDTAFFALLITDQAITVLFFITKLIVAVKFSKLTDENLYTLNFFFSSLAIKSNNLLSKNLPWKLAGCPRLQNHLDRRTKA